MSARRTNSKIAVDERSRADCPTATLKPKHYHVGLRGQALWFEGQDSEYDLGIYSIVEFEAYGPLTPE